MRLKFTKTDLDLLHMVNYKKDPTLITQCEKSEIDDLSNALTGLIGLDEITQDITELGRQADELIGKLQLILIERGDVD